MSKLTFDFSEALRRMKEGKKVKRTSWEKTAKIWVEQGRTCLRVFSTLKIDYIEHLPLEDVFATDWEEVK